MLKINFSNIENIILFDGNVTVLFDDLQEDINAWKFSKVQGIQNIENDYKIKVLNSLNEEHIQKLSNYFKDEVTVEKLNNKLSWSETCKVDDTLSYLNHVEPVEKFCIYRNKDQVYFTYWR